MNYTQNDMGPHAEAEPNPSNLSLSSRTLLAATA